MNMEIPKIPDVPEIDVLSIDDNERNPHVVLVAIEHAKKVIAPWGRNGDEFSTLLQHSVNISNSPTPENMKAAIRYMKSLLADKQDYN